MKFTERGGRISVSWFADREHAGIRVADTGVGIAADKLESIFEPFVQIGRTFATSAHEGVGLGLGDQSRPRASDGRAAICTHEEHPQTWEIRHFEPHAATSLDLMLVAAELTTVRKRR